MRPYIVRHEDAYQTNTGIYQCARKSDDAVCPVARILAADILIYLIFSLSLFYNETKLINRCIVFANNLNNGLPFEGHRILKVPNSITGMRSNHIVCYYNIYMSKAILIIRIWIVCMFVYHQKSASKVKQYIRNKLHVCS
jgi:hypothetical protein